MPHAIQMRQTGGPEVLNWTTVDVGEPASGQVRLRQAAAGLNYIDVYRRTGYYPQPLPFIPGLEGTGTVEAVAQDVGGLKVGDRVAYRLSIQQGVSMGRRSDLEGDCSEAQWLSISK
jgi:NADPH:quinone reductase